VIGSTTVPPTNLADQKFLIFEIKPVIPLGIEPQNRRPARFALAVKFRHAAPAVAVTIADGPRCELPLLIAAAALTQKAFPVPVMLLNCSGARPGIETINMVELASVPETMLY
jgi:hypothetical protein